MLLVPLFIFLFCWQEADTLEKLNETCNAAEKQNQKGIAQDDPQLSANNLGKLDSPLANGPTQALTSTHDACPLACLQVAYFKQSRNS